MATTIKNKYIPTISPVTLEERLDNDGREIISYLRNVSVTFGKGIRAIQAVKGISFNIYEGEVLGLVGESGSGKSTTGNAIMGLVSRKEGQINILGRNLPKNINKLKGELNKFIVNKTQMIFQDPANSLNPHKNIYKVISEGLDNIDVKSAYMKIFDNKTLVNVLKIIKKEKYKIDYFNTFDKIKYNEYQNNKEYLKIKELLYVNPLGSIEPINKMVITYLKLRMEERNIFTLGKLGTKAIKRKLVIDILGSVGLSERILNRFPLEFSGGQQQRIGISRAVVLRPKLLVADEPISALDVSIQAQVINIFNDLKKNFNLSILLIAHDLRMVEYISDRIAVMYKGVVVEIGTTDEISKHPIHPYTKSLLAAVPSIDSHKKSLSDVQYDSTQHNYDEKTQPSWFKVGSTGKRFVLGTKKEIEKWAKEA
ncbi:ABC transporter ATP-binding protein [Mycoplasma marinum]|uniref:ABC transporter ATP-binding protein n=1 Tax=Mycoplasma marinum TaxID=1937190 RepID=A0A4R0XLZ1_9MOLU|nr:ABC transporter ATP-binding protein [Mycoplasma marinum]TCG11726.1 ABC transporter ATP-binding protein [Mycoplasma marinum]